MANEDPAQGAQPIEDVITDDIGGVQGDDARSDADGESEAQSAALGVVADEPAPDGAEIEWAGGVVKKPPTPEGGA